MFPHIPIRSCTTKKSLCETKNCPGTIPAGTERKNFSACKVIDDYTSLIHVGYNRNPSLSLRATLLYKEWLFSIYFCQFDWILCFSAPLAMCLCSLWTVGRKNFPMLISLTAKIIKVHFFFPNFSIPRNSQKHWKNTQWISTRIKYCNESYEAGSNDLRGNVNAP